MARDAIVGIDLGTTNSSVAVCKDGEIEIVAEDGAELMPSYVGLTPEGRLVVGTEARNQYALYPECTVRSIKRKMGSNEKVRLGERECLPQEISGMILRELKERAERRLGGPVDKAVITVPAYFSDAQRQATREAGAMAGLEVVRIINEPTAACLAYEARNHTEARCVLAFDLGGGTFDVSVVNIDGDLVEVAASHGDTNLGGDDFDELIRERLRKHLSEGEKAKTEEKEVKFDSVGENRLLHAAEDGKIRLSDDTFARIIEDNLVTDTGKRKHLEFELTRDELGELLMPLLRKTLTSVRQALADADRKPSDIQEILLVGGSTRLPFVADMLHEELHMMPRRDVHPDLAVAYGAGVMAARLAGQSEQRLLIDITPYTFGTSALGLLDGIYCPYKFCPVIESGTPLPVSKTETFYTAVDGQEAVDVKIFEGQDEDARKNILIGRFLVEGLSEDAPEGSEILLHMDLDLDGILRVAATEKSTGLSKDLVIERATEKLSGEELAESRAEIDEMFGEFIADSGGEHTEEAPPILEMPAPEKEGDNSFPEARKTQDRLRGKLEGMGEADRQDAEELDAGLTEALANNDEREIERIVREIDDLIFYVESGA